MFCCPPDSWIGSKRSKIRALRFVSKQPPYHYATRPRGFRRPETAEKPVAGSWFANFHHERRRTRQYFFAAVSHLPHLAAFAYVHALVDHPHGKDYLPYAATGFRDFTRIASSHPAVWTDICMANRPALLKLTSDLKSNYPNWNSSFQTATKPSFTAILKKPHKCVMTG